MASTTEAYARFSSPESSILTSTINPPMFRHDSNSAFCEFDDHLSPSSSQPLSPSSLHSSYNFGQSNPYSRMYHMYRSSTPSSTTSGESWMLQVNLYRRVDFISQLLTFISQELSQQLLQLQHQMSTGMTSIHAEIRRLTEDMAVLKSEIRRKVSARKVGCLFH